MESVGMFAKTIVVLSFLWCIAETIMPDKSMRKYSSLIYGIVIVSLTVSVFTKIDYENLILPEDVSNVSEYSSSYIKDLYEKQISTALAEQFNDDSVKVELTDDYKIDKVHCNNEKTYDDIMRYLNE